VQREGHEPAAFAIVSPGAACNLRCSHCYAASGVLPAHRLSLDQVDRLVAALEATGTSLTILSGGEPLVWRDGGKGLFDLVARHPHMLFIVYSNGTLLDASVAGRIREAGNVLPLLSVEGLAVETDRVRGPGVYGKVLHAMANLRAAGVLFGVSVTATPDNAHVLRSDAFLRAMVDESGASFVWVLDLAPLGRAEEAATLDCAQRDAIQAHLNEETGKGRLVVSFLHTPLSPTGCFGARRFDGFFYLDWEADVRRCVYRPRVHAQAHLDRQDEVEALLAACAQLPACPLLEALPPEQGSLTEVRS
jgi:MoaA/NifB/PqqE/SkfB family radical SAM enzyme